MGYRAKEYIKNQKDPGGGKWVSAQDEEDYEQEKLINEWLKREGRSGDFDLGHINRKGLARSSLVRAHVSLDQKIGPDPEGSTFADFIAGSDGRDLEYGEPECDPEREAREQISRYLYALGFKEEEHRWLIKTLKLSTPPKRSHFEKSAIDLELLTPFEPFST